MMLVLILFVLLFHYARRRLVGLTTKVLAPSSPPTLPMPSPTALPFLRADRKATIDHIYDELEAASSSSSTQSSRIEVPLDDHVLDQLAHRVASIVQGDSPPSYSASTS